jgi:hypothetical protein
MTRTSGWRTILALAIVVILCALPGANAITRALQSQEQADIFSPASGHAQVIAQGVATPPPDAVWRAVFHSIEPGATSELPASGPSFILVDTGGVLVDDGSDLVSLAPSEATFLPGAAPRLIPIGERPVGVFAIDLVSPEAAEDAGNGIPVFASAPFQSPEGIRDVDLVRDLLEPGESTTVIGNEAPVLLLVTLGSIRAEATDGSAATLRVGEAATFSGDIVVTAEGQAPATFIAAVIGREVPFASGTPGATPAPEVSGSVQVAVYACPPAVTLDNASPDTCLPDPEAVALTLARIEDSALNDVGSSTERQGLPTWSGLPAGDYALQASAFKEGFGRFFVRGLEGLDGGGEAGFGAAENAGYRVPIGVGTADHALEVFVLGPTTGEARPQAATPAAQSTRIPSVITIEGETPTAQTPPTPTAAVTATATPRPAPIVTATPRPTEPAFVTSTAVAQPRRGSVAVRIFGCLDSAEAFNPANCAQAVDGFDVRLVNEDGEIFPFSEATVAADGTVTWENLPLGAYLFQQPVLLPGTVTYYIPNLSLNVDATGYILTLESDAPIASFDVFSLPPAAEPTPAAAPTAAAPVDSDLDGLPDADEIAVYGTDPANADSDFDGILDGDEIAAGTNPLVAESADIVAAADSDGDGLTDADEAGFGTDPNLADTDGDGWFDGDEINLGTDPFDATVFPAG